MIKITARQNEPIDSLLRRFNNAVMADGILQEYKEKSVYDKPSVRKRRLAKKRQMERLSNKTL